MVGQSCKMCRSLVPPIIVSLVIGAILGAVIGGQFYYYKKGIADARAKLEKAGVLTPLPTESNSVFGKVSNFDGQKMIVEAFPAYDPLASDRKPIFKNAVLTTETSAFKRVNNPKFGTPKSTPFYDEGINLSDISVGDQVVVEADENILNKSEFKAKTIILVNK